MSKTRYNPPIPATVSLAECSRRIKEMADALAAVTAERDRLREERDTLIAKWPETGSEYYDITEYPALGIWDASISIGMDGTTSGSTFPTKADAVRYAIGLQPLTPEAR